MSDAEEYLEKKMTNAKYTNSEMDFVVLEKDALEAVRLARKEVVMNPDKFIKDFQMTKEYQKIADEVLEKQLMKKIRKELVNQKKGVRLETAKEMEKKIDLFFDNEIEYIYNKAYGDDDYPMPFDEVKQHLIEFLSLKPQSDNKDLKK